MLRRRQDFDIASDIVFASDGGGSMVLVHTQRPHGQQLEDALFHALQDSPWSDQMGDPDAVGLGARLAREFSISAGMRGEAGMMGTSHVVAMRMAGTRSRETVGAWLILVAGPTATTLAWYVGLAPASRTLEGLNRQFIEWRDVVTYMDALVEAFGGAAEVTDTGLSIATEAEIAEMEKWA